MQVVDGSGVSVDVGTIGTRVVGSDRAGTDDFIDTLLQFIYDDVLFIRYALWDE